MDFVHFLKSQRYRSRVPLRQLQFTVAVYRAIVVEEANVELLAEVTVPWDGKVFSPPETLQLYQDLSHLIHKPSLANNAVHTAPANALPAGATSRSPPSAPAAAAALGLDPPSPANAAAPQTAGVPNMLALPAPHELMAQLRKSSSAFFTRPSQEDFIDRAEEDVPVDPPQGPSLLAPIVLRQHRRDHQPNRKMFLMWATGDVFASAGGLAGEGASPADPLAASSDPPNIEVDAIQWSGKERVLCTLTAEQDDHVFTARPSLNDVHTLYVDAAHIYTFRVTVSKAESAEGHVGRWLGDTPHGALDTTAAPLDAVLTNVRELAHYAETQFDQLEVSADAVARRLLRQAAMLAPPERGTSGPSIVAAAAASANGIAAPLEDGKYARRGSLGFSVPPTTAAGADRRASVALGATGLMSLAQQQQPPQQRLAGMSGVLLSRSTVMRSGHALPQGMCQYYVFGTVERCIGLAESTLFLRCQIVEDGAATSWMYDPLATSSPSAVCEFSSQLAHISTFVENECVLDVDHVFNLPFDYTFVGAAVASSPLRLIVSAFTEGAAAEGLQSAVAYACVSLPIASPGRHAVTAALWAPHKSGVEFLRSVLVGGAPSLVDARQAGPPPSHRTGVSVKEGLYADSVGTVHVTVNILQHKS